MPWTIRKGTPDDAEIASEICFLTGDAGKTAEGLYAHSELLGLRWAVPYFRLSSTFAYVLVSNGEGEPERILGYICGAADTREYEQEAGTEWWPALREKYPVGALIVLGDDDKPYVRVGGRGRY